MYCSSARFVVGPFNSITQKEKNKNSLFVVEVGEKRAKKKEPIIMHGEEVKNESEILK